jgi:hypothetical protein
MQKISFFLRGIEKVGITIPLLSFAKLSKLTQKISVFFKRNSKSRDHNTPTFFCQIVKFNAENIASFLRGIQKVGITIPLLSFTKLSKLMQKISVFLRGIKMVGITILLLSFAKLSKLKQKISGFFKRNSKDCDHYTHTFSSKLSQINAENITVNF